MSRVDPFTLPRVKRTCRQVSLKDSRLPDGGEVNLVLWRLDAAGQAVGMELADELIQQYITGDDETGEPPVPFPAIGGESVDLSELLFRTVAMVAIMQRPPASQAHDWPGQADAAYTPQELVALSVTLPDAWSQLNKEIVTISKRERILKNASGAAAGPSSDSPSDTTEPTLSISSE